MFRLEIKLPTREDTVVYDCISTKDAYRLLRHHCLPQPDAAIMMEEHQLWSVKIKTIDSWWKLERRAK